MNFKFIGAVAGGVVASVTIYNRLQKAKNRREENQRWFEKEMTKLDEESRKSDAMLKQKIAESDAQHERKMREMDEEHQKKMDELRADRETIEAEFASIRDKTHRAQTTEELESAYADYMLVAQELLKKKRD